MGIFQMSKLTNTLKKMDENQKLHHLLRYLEILSNGKIRPDRSDNCGNIRDAKENIPDINAAKTEINNILQLELISVKPYNK